MASKKITFRFEPIDESASRSTNLYVDRLKPIESSVVPPSNLQLAREFHRKQRHVARLRGFTTGSSDDRRYAHLIDKARNTSELQATRKPMLVNRIVLKPQSRQPPPQLSRILLPKVQASSRTMTNGNVKRPSTVVDTKHHQLLTTVDRVGSYMATASFEAKNLQPLKLSDLSVSYCPNSPIKTNSLGSELRLNSSQKFVPIKQPIDPFQPQIRTVEQPKLKSIRRPPITTNLYWRSELHRDSEEDEQAYRGRFKCDWDDCDDILPSNIGFINHVLAHFLRSVSKNGEEEDSSNLAGLCRCQYCFTGFSTPYHLQSHLLAVHSNNRRLPSTTAQNLVCHICNRDFHSTDLLTAHIHRSHQFVDAPYCCRKCRFRSSLHCDLTYHFRKHHYGSSTLMCPLCLCLFHPTTPFANIRTTVINVANFTRHMEMHVDRMVVIPFVHGHPLSLSDSEGHQDPCRHLLRTSEKTITLRGAVCVECRRPMNDTDHFLLISMTCTICPFTTCCNRSYANHVCDHVRGSQSNPSIVFHKSDPLLSSPGSCRCGFDTVRANLLAEHVVHCFDGLEHGVYLSNYHCPNLSSITTKDDVESMSFSVLRDLRIRPNNSEFVKQPLKRVVNGDDRNYFRTKTVEIVSKQSEQNRKSSSRSPPPQLIRSLSFSPNRKRRFKSPIISGVIEPIHKNSVIKRMNANDDDDDEFVPRNSTSEQIGSNYEQIRAKSHCSISKIVNANSHLFL